MQKQFVLFYTLVIFREECIYSYQACHGVEDASVGSVGEWQSAAAGSQRKNRIQTYCH